MQNVHVSLVRKLADTKTTPRGGRYLAALLSFVSSAVLTVGGCATVEPEVTLAATGDPLPNGFSTAQTLDAAGGRVERGTVTVEAEAGAVQDGHEIRVSIGAPLGEVTSSFAEERYGQPVRVDHDAPLAAPLTITWDVAGLAVVQRQSMVTVRWDDAMEVWTPSGEAIVVEGDSASVQVSEFSIINWVAVSEWWADNITQNVGAALGNRVDAPRCATDPLPSWVSAIVRPDEGMDAVALRTCFEPDVEDRLTLRVTNNRSFAQRLAHRAGDQSWAWTWGGPADLSPEGIVYSTAWEVFGSDTSVFLPPTHEVAVGFARPEIAGFHHVELATAVDGVTVATDIVASVFGSQPVGGLSNPVMNAFVQVVFECAGRQLLSQPNLTDPAQLVNTAMRTVKSCTAEILRWDSDFGLAFEELSRTLIAQGGTTSAVAVQANRIVRQLANVMVALDVADFSWYVSDQIAENAVGPTLVSFNATGRPEELGAWTPTCTDTAADSNLLYRNLALRDEFADKSRDLWEFPAWASSATVAVRPLAACTVAYREQLADLLPGTWGDSRAAGIVADGIRKVAPQSAAVEQTGPGEYTIWFNHPTWGHVRLVTRQLVNEPGPASITVLDSAGEVRFAYQNEFQYLLQPAGIQNQAGAYGSPYSVPTSPMDAQGNIFLDFNPGRYNGVIVLRPTTNGFEDFGTLPALPDGYRTDFYYATVVDVDGDGTYEVQKFSNDCTPSCAGGKIGSEIYWWNGSSFAPDPEKL